MTIIRYGKIVSLILYVVAVGSTIAVFLTAGGPSASSASFWVSLVTVLAAETALWRYADHLIRNPNRVRRMVPGYLALGTVITAYFILTVIYAFVAGIADLALPWLIVIHILTLAAVVFICGLALFFIRSSMNQEQKIQIQATSLHEIQLGLKQLQGKIGLIHCPGKEQLEDAIAELLENVQYSDPIALTAVAHHDQYLLDEIKVLHEQVTSIPDADNQEHLLATIVHRVRQLKQRLGQRNEQLLALKS